MGRPVVDMTLQHHRLSASLGRASVRPLLVSSWRRLREFAADVTQAVIGLGSLRAAGSKWILVSPKPVRAWPISQGGGNAFCLLTQLTQWPIPERL